jgi:hypothetical protein
VLEAQFLATREKLETTVHDLTKQIEMLRGRSELSVALKDEELAAELALAEGKYQSELSALKERNNAKIGELMEKVQYQQELIDTLEREKSDSAYNAERIEQELAKYQFEVGDLKKETKMMELSQSEKLKLAKQSAQSIVEELKMQLSVAKQKAMQEQMDLEERWRNQLSQKDMEYLEKLKLQRQQMESEVLGLKNKLSLTADSRDEEIKEMQVELEDNQNLIQLLSQEKHGLTADLEEKSKEIVLLNEEIIRLKEDMDTYREMASVAPLSDLSGRDLEKKYDEQKLASKNDLWYDEVDDSREYFAVVRKAILSKFLEFDFSDYADKVDVVKIDFELLANGTPKGAPKFLGTEDEELKSLLNRCFKDALPFPPFPENLKKASQRFALSISFKK